MRLSVFVILIFAANTFAQESALEKGVYWYEHRADGAIGTKADVQKINKAIRYFEEAYQKGIQPEVSGPYLVRSYYYKGRYAIEGKAEKKKLYAKAKKLGKELMEAYPGNAEVRFEYICAVGMWAEQIGVIQAGWDGVIGKMKDNADILMELDPEFSSCAAPRIIGVMHLQAPYLPLVLTWPDDEEALELLKQAYECDPEEFTNVYYYAEALYENGQEEKARELLRHIETMTPHDHLLLEDRSYQRLAKSKLKEWE